MNQNDYGKYLTSPEWRTTRNRALKRVGYHCQRCGARRNLQVHHRSYERLGHERDDDLEVLCESCHRGHHHEELHDMPESRLYLQLASDALRADPFAPVAEIVAAVKDECVRLKLPRDFKAIDRAVNILVGSNRFRPAPPPPRTIEEAYSQGLERQGRALTHAESVECLHRLGFDRLIKTIPSGPPPKIDIYGPPPEEDFSYEVY